MGFPSMAQNIVGYEYWFDQDDVNRVYEQVAAGQVVSVINNAIGASGLPVGEHEIHFRLIDDNGYWSSVTQRTFFQPPNVSAHEVVALRYWSDLTSQPPSDMEVVSLQSASVYQDTFNLDLCDFTSTGVHEIFFQLKDNVGYWSAVVSKTANLTAVGAPSTPGAITGASPVCEGSTEGYSVSPVAGAAIYTWTLPNGWTGTSNTNIINAGIGSSGGNITIQVSNSCGTSSAQSLAVAVNAQPATPSITENGGVLTSDATSGNQWYLDGNPINGATDQNYTAVQNGDYHVVVTDGTCTSDESNTISIINVGIDERTQSGLVFYPNPTNDNLWIEVDNTFEKNQLQVLDMQGRMVLQEQLLQGRQNVALPELAAGTYVLRFVNEKDVVSHRLIIN